MKTLWSRRLKVPEPSHARCPKLHRQPRSFRPAAGLARHALRIQDPGRVPIPHAGQGGRLPLRGWGMLVAHRGKTSLKDQGLDTGGPDHPRPVRRARWRPNFSAQASPATRQADPGSPGLERRCPSGCPPSMRAVPFAGKPGFRRPSNRTQTSGSPISRRG